MRHNLGQAARLAGFGLVAAISAWGCGRHPVGTGVIPDPTAGDDAGGTGDQEGSTAPDAWSDVAAMPPTHDVAGFARDARADAATVSYADGGQAFWPAACSTCHGSTANPAPPQDPSGNTATTALGVGAHQAHLGPSAWHKEIPCAECHPVPKMAAFDPAVPTHLNGIDDVVWGPLAKQGTFDQGEAATCTNTYCHGASLLADVSGAKSVRAPVWTKVDGTQDACGQACHTTPPGGTHPVNTACGSCHGDVIKSFVGGTPPVVVWKNAALHIDGIVEANGAGCTSCHGDVPSANPAPPRGTAGETLTTQVAVGAHAKHLGPSTWHRTGECRDCHLVPTSTRHSNKVVELTWHSPADADGATPAFTAAGATCAGTYCHGATLLAAKTGGTVNRVPVWTKVDGTAAACGTTCHTNPPGGTHPNGTNCATCHGAVVASFNPATNATTWTDATKHMNGTVESSSYHDLTGWKTPKTGAAHHGRVYFLGNAQRDEHSTACTQCHGANLDGGTSGVSCANASCHGGQDWRSCTYCHGTPPSQKNPPRGVWGETAINTLAVGRHTAHLAASATHVAFACGTCHVEPAAGNVAHTLGYVPTSGLDVPGHHGDVTFSGPAAGMVWNVAATSGTPIAARGTCTKACHSNGAGGAPVVTPYWAGGTWAAGNCGNCHAAKPSTGKHGKHDPEGGCTMCHQPANTATHMNGTTDTLPTAAGPKGGSVVVVRPGGGNCGTRASCYGTCHGETHQAGDACW